MATIELVVELQGWRQGKREAFQNVHDWLEAKFLSFIEAYLRPFVGDDDKTTKGPSTRVYLARDAFSRLLEDLSLRVEESDAKLLAVLAEQCEVHIAASGEAVVVVRLFEKCDTQSLAVWAEQFEVHTAAHGETVVVVKFLWDKVKDEKVFERLCQQIPSQSQKYRQVLREYHRRFVQGEGIAKDETVEEKLFRGKVTGRLLEERERFIWRGEKAFESLCYQILKWSCQQVLREHFSRRQDISLDSNPHTEEQRGPAYNERIIGSVSEGETLLVQGDAVYAFVEGLAQFSEQLRHAGQVAVSETVEALLLYVKSKAAQTHPVYVAYGIEELQHIPIERLLSYSTMCALDSDEDDAWRFVEHTLQLNRLLLHKRKQLLCQQAQQLPVHDSLRAVLGLLWLRDMHHLVEDCQKRGGQLRLAADRLCTVEVFLRWQFAKGHPSHRIRLQREQREAELHKRKVDLTWLERMASKALFTSNNPQVLRPTYPGACGFRQFVAVHYPYTPNTTTTWHQLLDALEHLKPRPIRLIPLIKELGLIEDLQ